MFSNRLVKNLITKHVSGNDSSVENLEEYEIAKKNDLLSNQLLLKLQNKNKKKERTWVDDLLLGLLVAIVQIVIVLYSLNSCDSHSVYKQP